MIETRTPRDTRTMPGRAQAPAGGGGRPAPPAAGRGRPGLRAGVRLWSLLRAGALLGGPAGAPHDPAVIEDDSRRMAGRRAR
jgi:hypothetical protein